MNCIILEDDPASRKLIEEYVRKTSELKLLHSFENALEAIEKIHDETRAIELVFLDIEMPEMNGYEFLETINQPFQVIVITAKEKYAVEAFEHNVSDYLLKPIAYSRFYKAVSKIIEEAKKDQNIKNNVDSIFIKQGNKIVRVQFNDILWIKAYTNYVNVVTFDNKYTIHNTMKEILSNFPTTQFKRVHRSYIVNINHISEINDKNLYLQDSNEDPISIPVGRSYRNNILNDTHLYLK